MKRITLLAVMTFLFAVPSGLMAQDYNHVEVGGFVDYLNLGGTSPHINFVGLGGRVAVNVHPHVQLEAEMAYDFKRNFTNVFSDGVTSTFVTSRVRPLTALVGPKFQTSGPVRFFVTTKVGLINFSTETGSIPGGFTSSINGITDGDTKFAFYPGVGVEGFWGPIGLRLEAGDNMYFDNGTRNNFRVTFGPQFRF
jgi:Outer membrane protein beta-barrel domain